MKKELFFSPDAAQMKLTWTLLENAEPDALYVGAIETQYRSYGWEFEIWTTVNCGRDSYVLMTVRIDTQTFTTYDRPTVVSITCFDHYDKQKASNKSVLLLELPSYRSLSEMVSKISITKQDTVKQLLFWIWNNAKILNIETKQR